VFFGKSKVPPGLPKWMNDRHNWATRGTLLFEPTLETSFVVNGHLSRRNEYSRLGQSYGTNGFFCLNGNIADCNTGAEDGGSKIFNVLGGKQGIVRGYQAPEVVQDLTFLAPCFQFGFGFRRPGQGGCTGNTANPNFALFDTAQQVEARKLARDLDDEPWKGDFNRAGKTTNDVYGGSLKGEYLLPWDLGSTRSPHTTLPPQDRRRPRLLAGDAVPDRDPRRRLPVLSGREARRRDAGERTPVRWDLGGWVLPEKIDVKADVDLGDLGAFGVGHREYTQRLLSFGGYGSFSFDFADDFTLDGGARWNWERKRMDYKLITGLNIPRFDQFQDIWSDPTGTIRLTYRFREDTHAFLKYTRGWKPGHYNATGSVFSGVTKAKPETINAYETGLAAQWFGGVLGGEASLFYYNQGLSDLHRPAVRAEQPGIRRDQRERRRGVRRRGQRDRAAVSGRLRERELRLARDPVPRLPDPAADDGDHRHRLPDSQPRAPELGQSAAQLAALQGGDHRRAGNPDRALRLPDPALRRRVERRHLLRRRQGPRPAEPRGIQVHAQARLRAARALGARRPARLPHAGWSARDRGLGAQPRELRLQDLLVRREQLHGHVDPLRRRPAHLRRDAQVTF
jgi:hypothetical protein